MLRGGEAGYCGENETGGPRSKPRSASLEKFIRVHLFRDFPFSRRFGIFGLEVFTLQIQSLRGTW